MRVTAPERHLLRAKDFADAHYADPISVEDLAHAANFSPGRFSERFRRAFGLPPHAYLLTRRLERAAVLLRTTDWTVAQIASSVGWQSVGSFTTSFTRMYARSPTAYRASCPPGAALAFIPACVARTYGRPQHRTSREDTPAGRS